MKAKILLSSVFFLTIQSLGLFVGKAQIVNPNNSLLWEVSSNNIKGKSYIYGTIHIQDKKVFAFSDTVKTILESCDAYVMEIILDNSNSEEMEKCMIMKNNSLDQLLNKEDYELLKQVFESRTGISLFLFNKTKPFFISAQLMQTSMNNDMPLPLDMYFLDIAKKLNKKILGVEKLEDQIKAVDKIPLAEQCKMMMEGIKDSLKEKDKYNKLLDMYLNAKIDEMANVSQDSSYSESFNKYLLLNRNKKMAKSIMKIINKQSTFVVVGAAHLAGEQGILNLLRSKGYNVTPIQTVFSEN